MKHQIMFANSNRVFVRVQDTWYDTHRELTPVVGQPFLTGRIEEILDYKEYTSQFGKKVHQIYDDIKDKTHSGGWLRKVASEPDGEGSSVSRVVYGINPSHQSADGYTSLDFE